MAVVVEDMVVVDSLPVTWAALVVLAWRAARADTGMAAGPLVAGVFLPVRLCSWRRGIAALRHSESCGRAFPGYHRRKPRSSGVFF
jgi:hypothetical protein